MATATRPRDVSPTDGSRMPRDLPRARLLLLSAGGVALVLGIYTGLSRAGVEHRFVGADLHAVLMALGFLGTLIALERAVVLGRPWGYLAPSATALAVVLLPFARTFGGVALVVGGVVTALTYVPLLRRRLDLHLVVMGIGALAWVAAAVLWMAGAGPVRITPLLAAFLVLTIVGERLELSRLTSPGVASRRRFVASVVVFVIGVSLAPWLRATGLLVAGIGLVAQTSWLARHDLATRTIRRQGLPRFAAACMLSGYVWLGVSGALWIAMGLGVTGLLLHDALVHSLFLGFVMSMVMGHAPIIAPAVLRTPLGFSRVAYVPLVLLHASVAVRIVADLAGSLSGREVALHGNVAALLAFLLVTVVTVRRGTRGGAPSGAADENPRPTGEVLSSVEQRKPGRGTASRQGVIGTRGRPRRHDGPTEHASLRGLHRLAIATVVATLVLIAMGGAVRATNSGLACPDWPACYGKWIPPADVNMWFEHSHRLWAGVVGLAVAWLAAWTLLRFRRRPALWGLSLAAFVLVVVQAGLGAAVVLLHLRAGLVTSHLGMSLVVVACLIVLAVLTREVAPGSDGSDGARWAGRRAAVVGGLVFLQALLGGQATGRGAGHVFNAVPIWLAPEAWTGQAREWLHVSHRVGGYLVAVAVVAFAVAVRRRARSDASIPDWAIRLSWLAVVLVTGQVALGLANVLTRAGVFSSIGHLSVASWLWAAFVLMAARGLLAATTGTGTSADARPDSAQTDAARPDSARTDTAAPGTGRTDAAGATGPGSIDPGSIDQEVNA